MKTRSFCAVWNDQFHVKTGGTTIQDDRAPRGQRTAVSRLGCRGTVRPVGPLVALLPAHDEEASLGAALDSLRSQTRPPDRIVVVADNCTDRTVEIARERGVEVYETVDNAHKKAGALNQVLEC